MIDLILRFPNQKSVNKFQEFLEYALNKAGTYLSRERVTYMPVSTGDMYIIKGSPEDIYTLGYEWALFQNNLIK